MSIAMILFSLLSFAQNKNVVTGVVTDSKGLAIPGVSVMIQGSKTGTSTDFDGKYTLQNVKSDDVIEFTFIGMESYAVKAGGQKTINATLKETTSNLNEVVVVGFGTQKKSNLTGAVSQVKMDEVLGDRPVTTVAAALQGAVPGLNITNAATPGVAATFNIRGVTSINSNGGGALVLIDNAEGDVNMLNPEDVESVSVLKDAASTAIYGARAAFGVVLITTKKAKKNSKTVFSYNNNFAYTRPINQVEQAPIADIVHTMANWSNTPLVGGPTKQNLVLWEKYIRDYNADPVNFLNNNPGKFQAEGRFLPSADPQSYYYLKDTDIQNGIFDNHGVQKINNFGAQGGSEKITYRLSFGTVNNDGPLITDKDNYERYNLGSYVSADLAKWINTSLDFKYNTSNRSIVSLGPIYRQLPNFTPVDTAVPKSTDLNGLTYIFSAPQNYIKYGNPEQYARKETRIFSRTVLTPFKGFEGVLEYTMDDFYNDYKYFSKSTDYMETNMLVTPSSQTPTYFNNKSNSQYRSLNAYITYAFQSPSGDHKFKLQQGFSQERTYYEALNVNRKEMINSDLPSISTGVGETIADDAFIDKSIRSTFYRVTYNYKDKYLLEANGRYDGSSKFPKETRFGFFPSFSAGWQVAKESFMTWSNSWLNEFKLRASWGQIGNQNIIMRNSAGNWEEVVYGYSPKMDSSRAPWLVGTTQPATLSLPPLVRQDYTWETAETTDFGVDMSFLKNRLQLSADYYIRKTKGMLAPGMELPAVVGATAPLQNTADLENKGWEASASWRDKIGKVGYYVGFNVYDSQAVITKYNNAAGLLTIDGAGNNTSYYVGQKIGEIWGYRNDGYYTVEDFKDTSTWALKDGVTSIKGTAVRPGDVKYKNLADNGTSVANQIDPGVGTTADAGDRQVIGSNAARYSYGINGGVNYAGFDFSFIMNGVGKRDAWVSDMLHFPLVDRNFSTVYSHQLDYWQPIDAANGNWQPINPNPEYPRLYNENANVVSNTRIQDRYLINAAYLRLKNLTLGYNVPANVVKKVGLNTFKVFCSVENPYTWSKLEKGRDPESLSWGYPFYTTTSFGLNLTF
ncbi:SusC/RagA family TonB-linked outer membrane protein [Flavobacterium mesophilum]|uniref:SusC/RagA family TonB-linked outer membrane protein n=1 Tax=Flavobacterium mesophilum TaxID=3143495 RepID=UPI0031E0A517